MKRKILLNKQTSQSARNLIDAFLLSKIDSDFVVYYDDEKLSIKKKNRSLEQNSKMWAMLGDVSNQCTHTNAKYSAEDWKDIFTASVKQDLRSTLNVDGDRVVLLGLKTSDMNTARLSTLIEFIQAYGDLNGVKWTA